MSLYWTQEEARFFRGFIFKVEDLPPEFQAPGRWREYLFTNRVPGYIYNDLMMLDDVFHNRRLIWCMGWEANETNVLEVSEHSRPRRHGWYSFTPDSANDVNNCVTWAIGTVRSVLGDVIDEIPNGRIKIALEAFAQKGASPSE